MKPIADLSDLRFRDERGVDVARAERGVVLFDGWRPDRLPPVSPLGVLESVCILPPASIVSLFCDEERLTVRAGSKGALSTESILAAAFRRASARVGGAFRLGGVGVADRSSCARVSSTPGNSWSSADAVLLRRAFRFKSWCRAARCSAAFALRSRARRMTSSAAAALKATGT